MPFLSVHFGIGREREPGGLAVESSYNLLEPSGLFEAPLSFIAVATFVVGE